MLVYGEGVVEWVYELSGGAVTASSSGLGWMRNDKLIAGMSVEGWNGKNCYVHLRLEGYAPKEFCFAAVDWVFNQLKCNRMTAPVPQSNNKCLKLLRHIGFEQEAKLQEASYDGGDLLFMRLWKEDCYLLNWNNHE